MISYFDLSWKIRSLLGVLLLATELGNIWNIIYAFRSKKKLYVYFSVMLFLASYILQETNIHIIELKIGLKELDFLPFVDWPAYIMLGLVTMVILLTVHMVFYNFWYRRTNLTPNVIRECADKLEVGVCYYRESGRILFQNREMNRICYELMGEDLLNGLEFYEVVKDGKVTLSDGSVWEFEHQTMDYYGAIAHELLAFDITELTLKSQKLASENEELKLLNKNLYEYNLKIDDMVRREEILQAKVNIHDEMNQLMLVTMADYDNEDVDKKLEILEMWKRNILLLSSEGKESSDIMKSVLDLAGMLKIAVECEGDSIDRLDDNLKELYCIAAREAIANASKHAKAKHLTMTININDEMTEFIYANDGIIPKENIAPSGGLINLERIVTEAGGRMKNEVSDKFSLIIQIDGTN